MRSLLSVFILTWGSLCAGCGGGGTNTSSGEAKYRIAVIPKGTTHVFWKSVHAGAEQAARELGDVEIVWKGPQNENDTEAQINVVQDFTALGVSGICLAPNDSSALVDAVHTAQAARIPVVIFDSGLEDENAYVSYVATDNYRGGVLAARRLAETLGVQPGGTRQTPAASDASGVILLRYKTGSESTEQREQGFLDTLRKDYADIPILVENEYSGTTRESALDKAQTLLSKYKGRVNGVFAVCEPNSVGVLEALQDLGLERKVKFIAFDPSEELIEGMRNDMIHGIVLQDPVKMGYLAVKTMVAHLEGKPVEKRIPTGEYVATRDNMAGKDADGSDIQKLLNPPRFGEK